MSTRRLLVVLLFSTLLSGCGMEEMANDIKELKAHVHSALAYFQGLRYANPCVAGTLQTTQCYYVMKITARGDDKKPFKANISEKVCEQNQGSGNKFENCKDFEARHSNYNFPVKGSPASIQPGKDYEFVSQVTDPPTNELLCVVYNDDTEKYDASRCEPRTKPLKLYTKPGP